MGRSVPERDLRAPYSKDLAPVVDALLDLQRLDLIPMEAALKCWALLRTDQELFVSTVRILEDEAAKAVALTTDAL